MPVGHVSCRAGSHLWATQCMPWCFSCQPCELRLQLVCPASCPDCTSRLSLPAAGSAAMTFASASTADGPAAEEQHLVLLGLLDGSLLAVAVTGLEHSTHPDGVGQASKQQQQQQQQHRPQQVALTVLWQVQGRAPIFSSPAADQQQGVVVVAAVDGTLQGLQLSSGRQLWYVQLQGQAFADLLLLHHPTQREQQEDTGAAGAGVHRCLTVVATKAGKTYGLDCRTGHQVCLHMSPTAPVCTTTCLRIGHRP